MLTWALLLHRLEGHLVRPPAMVDPRLGIDRVAVLGDQAVGREKGLLLVGAPGDALPDEAETGPSLPVLYARCGAGVDPAGLAGICTDLSLPGLLNLVLSALDDDRQWAESVRKALPGGTLQNVLAAGCAGAGLHAAVLNPGYRLIGEYACTDTANEFLAELTANGYLSFALVRKLEETIAGRDPAVFAADTPGGRLLYRTIGSGGFSVARLMLYSDTGSQDYLEAWADKLAECLQIYFLGLADYAADTELGSFLGDLIEGRLTNNQEIEDRLKRIKLFGHSKYRLVLVFFPVKSHLPSEEAVENTQSIPWNYIIGLLTQVFPFSKGVAYKGKILLIVRLHPGKSKTWYDEAMLLEILQRYNGYAAISNVSKFINSLRSIYHQANATLRLALAVSEDPARRVFWYENYSTYHIIEMCAETAREFYGMNLVYLCHPAFTAVLRHDQEHGTTFTKALITYLENERNITKSASQLHIHRNTMMYKIETMEGIIGFSLDDSMVRERILFSYRVMQFMSKYLHRDLLEMGGILETSGAD